MKLFIVEKSVGANLIALARPLTLDDVVVDTYGTHERSMSDSHIPNYINMSVSIKLTNERISEILYVTGAELTDNGSYTRHGLAASYVTDGWKPVPSAFAASIEEELSFRGLRSKESKEERLSEVFNATLEKFNASKEELTQAAMDKLNVAMAKVVEEHNKKVEDTLRRLVVDINVAKNTLEDCLNDEEKASVAQDEKAIEELESQISKLKAQKSEKIKSAYSTKREAITRTLKAQSGEMGSAYIETLTSEEKERDSFADIFG